MIQAATTGFLETKYWSRWFWRGLQEGKERILVYEYVPNESLDYFLFELSEMYGCSQTLLRKVSWTGLADTRSFVELLEGFYIFIKIHDSQSPQSE
ncbi:hypothetical protein YC2023_119282 [Brassica napus]